MFTINARRLAGVLAEFRRVLGVGKVLNNQLVTFITSGNRLTIRAKNEEASVAYETNCSSHDCQFIAQLSDLKFVGHASGTATFKAADGKVTVNRETNRCLNQYSAPCYPDAPILLHSNRIELAAAVRNAAKLTEPESRRYALGCIRLRSSDGQVAGTDGLQGFMQNGFSLPPGEFLVPTGAIKKFSALAKARTISVGLRDDWVAFRVGTLNALWSLDVKRQTSGRFPDLDRCLPSLADSQARFTLGESDAQFLIEQLRRLSPDRYDQGPVTIQLGNVPVLRMRLRPSEYNRLFPHQGHALPEQMVRNDEHRYRQCDIHLDSSTSSGVELRCAVDHLHLLALLQFGFRQIEFLSDQSPVYCIDRCRSYVCSVKNPSFVIAPGIVDVCLASNGKARVA